MVSITRRASRSSDQVLKDEPATRTPHAVLSSLCSTETKSCPRTHRGGSACTCSLIASLRFSAVSRSSARAFATSTRASNTAPSSLMKPRWSVSRCLIQPSNGASGGFSSRNARRTAAISRLGPSIRCSICSPEHVFSAGPGQQNTLRVDVEIAAARRKAEATDVLIDRRVADVQAALTEYGAAWALQLERDYGEAVRAWLALLDVVAESQSKMAAAESFRGFVRSGRWWARTRPTTGSTGRSAR